jgi:hypothetical protein
MEVEQLMVVVRVFEVSVTSIPDSVDSIQSCMLRQNQVMSLRAERHALFAAPGLKGFLTHRPKNKSDHRAPVSLLALPLKEQQEAITNW